jgi:hypothetical protein
MKCVNSPDRLELLIEVQRSVTVKCVSVLNCSSVSTQATKPLGLPLISMQGVVVALGLTTNFLSTSVGMRITVSWLKGSGQNSARQF